MMTDYEKGAIQLAIAAAAETVRTVVRGISFTYSDDLTGAYTREAVLTNRSGSGEDVVRELAWQFRRDGQWGY